MEEVYGGQTQPPYLEIVYLLRYIHCKCSMVIFTSEMTLLFRMTCICSTESLQIRRLFQRLMASVTKQMAFLKKQKASSEDVDGLVFTLVF